MLWYHQSTLAAEAPVRRPAEVPGVDVGRESLLEPVELVGPDEVHLPAGHVRYPSSRR